MNRRADNAQEEIKDAEEGRTLSHEEAMQEVLGNWKAWIYAGLHVR